jgi:DNA-binding LacI/PurR family transcriptional regulator
MDRERISSIADIARMAGVSKSTVSRALNDSPLIGVETKERIRSIAKEHGFEIDVRARRLSLQKSGTIALVAYVYKADSVMPDAFMLGMMTGISAGLGKNDYDLLLTHVSPTDASWPRRYLEAGRVDGFIMLEAECTRRQLEALVATRAPFVLWGPPSTTNAYPSVSGDSLTGGRVATEHLVRIGRRRIAFIGGPPRELEVLDRLRGYETALRDAGLPVDPQLIAHGDYSEQSGATAMAELLDRAADLDAVFVNSDVMAITAMETLRERGREIPADVAVVGYDDIPLAHHVNPPLTTIRQDPILAGRLLAETLIERLRTGVVTSVSIPAELVVRGSA